MRQHHVLPLLFAAAGLGPGCAREGSGVDEAALAPGANVLVIVVDTLRFDHLGTWGSARPTSPSIDALGAEALVVDHMVAQASWTKPSVASLFTSLFPSQHQTVEESTRNHLAGSLLTLAECFQAAGYRTGGFSENPHISPTLGFGQGFETLQTLGGFQGDSSWVVDSARAWLDRLEQEGSERPGFLYVHFLDPHGPYEPDPATRAEFLGALEASNELVEQGRIGQLTQGGGMSVAITPMDVEYLEALYDAEIRRTDAAIGALLADLRRRGWLDDAVVLFTSDHGEEFLEHGTLKHGYQLFEETVRVPLILRVPGQAPRREREATVQHIDLAPTLLELTGLPVPAQYRGHSLVPLLSGAALESRPVVSETSWRGIDKASARQGRWKLIVDRISGEERLFDLETDPGELRDQLAAQPDVAGRLRATLEIVCRPPTDLEIDGVSGERDPEAEAALKALGYFGR